MTTDFDSLNLHPELVQAVTERGYAAPTPIQAAVIPALIAGRDIIGQAQTGTGKTAAYALPILHNLQPSHERIQALVLAPTRELALQVAEAFNAYGRLHSARVLAVYGGQAYGPQIGQLRRGVDIVVGTPGRLLDLMRREVLDLSAVRSVVLDEADEMLSMGFIEDIETVLNATPAERQTALFSATMPPEIRRLADRYLRDPQVTAIQREQVTVETIEQRYYLVNESDKTAALTRLFEMEEITSALVFVRTRAGTGELANELSVRGFSAEALSGDLSQDMRERTLLRFRENKVQVLVATDVAARGLDIDDISHVFNYDLPEDPEIYVHRIGRTGRAGKTGVAVSLVSPFERRRLANIERFVRRKINRAALPTEEDIRKAREEKLLGQVTMWLRRGRCLNERALIEKMVAEGADPLAVAAAALKVARADEKQRPIYPVSEVPEPRPIASHADRRPMRGSDRGPARGADRPAPRSSERSPMRARQASSISHEPGMVRLSLSMGRQHGARPNDIVGVIAYHANIPGRAIGKIYIEDHRSLVDVPEEFAEQVLAQNGSARFHRIPVDVVLA